MLGDATGQEVRSLSIGPGHMDRYSGLVVAGLFLDRVPKLLIKSDILGHQLIRVEASATQRRFLRQPVGMTMSR